MDLRHDRRHGVGLSFSEIRTAMDSATRKWRKEWRERDFQSSLVPLLKNLRPRLDWREHHRLRSVRPLNRFKEGDPRVQASPDDQIDIVGLDPGHQDQPVIAFELKFPKGKSISVYDRMEYAGDISRLESLSRRSADFVEGHAILLSHHLKARDRPDGERLLRGRASGRDSGPLYRNFADARFLPSDLEIIEDLKIRRTSGRKRRIYPPTQSYRGRWEQLPASGTARPKLQYLYVRVPPWGGP